MQANPEIPDDYPQYTLPTFLVTERSFQSIEQVADPNKYRAFTIANKTLPAVEANKLAEAEKMAYHALSLDPLCIDAWRMLCNILNQNCDGDTIVCALREVMSFSRPFFEKDFKNPGMFYTLPHTRPYIRILADLGKTALRGDMLDVAIYAYEECIRLNHKDDMISRDPLLCCYVKIIGRIKKFPKTTPVRTIDQILAFINTKFDDIPLFDQDTLTVRWAKLCFAYIQNENWQELAKNEHSKDDHIFKVLFNEMQIQRLPPSTVEMPNGFMADKAVNEVRAYGYIKEAMEDWPELIIDLRRLFNKKISPQIEEDIKMSAPNPDNDLNPLYKQQALKDAESFLSQARNALSKRSFENAVTMFTFAKNGFDEASLPSRRWYLHSPFAVASNRATAAFQLKMWNLVRIDSRFTLLMKPDHERTYLRLPAIAKAFGAKQLVDDFDKIAKIVEKKILSSWEDWSKLAKKAIGLLALPVIAFAADGNLTYKMKEKFIDIGIDNMYETVNVGLEQPVLPWLKDNDFEPQIPDI